MTLRSLAVTSVRVVDSLAFVIVLLIAWQLWVTVGHAPDYIIASPRDVASQMVTEADYLLPEAWVTFQEIALGLVLGTAVGVPLAIGIASWRPFERIVYPILVTSQVVPKIAVAPLFLVWLGFGIKSKILIAFLIAFFPIVLETVAGLRSLSVEKLYLARSTGAGAIRTFIKIRLPNALPSMFTGLKIASAFAVTGAVVGEFAGADQGVGRAILSASSTGDTPFTFAAVAYVTAMGFGVYYSVVLLERVALPWVRVRRHR